MERKRDIHLSPKVRLPGLLRSLVHCQQEGRVNFISLPHTCLSPTAQPQAGLTRTVHDTSILIVTFASIKYQLWEDHNPSFCLLPSLHHYKELPRIILPQNNTTWLRQLGHLPHTMLCDEILLVIGPMPPLTTFIDDSELCIKGTLS